MLRASNRFAGNDIRASWTTAPGLLGLIETTSNRTGAGSPAGVCAHAAAEIATHTHQNLMLRGLTRGPHDSWRVNLYQYGVLTVHDERGYRLCHRRNACLEY